VAPRTPNRGWELNSSQETGRGTKNPAVLLVGRVASSKLLGHIADSLPLAQIQSERASSPAGVLFYQPQSAACDGKWHKISVKLRRPKKPPLFSSRCSGPSAMQAASKAPLRAPYSCRKAFMGSTRAARRAGMYAASTATAKTTKGTTK
jgi:hypothetical protein